jgi:type II secretory pathway pseudopilin PulG
MPTILQHLLRKHTRISSSGGFGMIELIISVIIGGMILAAISQMIVSQIRASTQQVEIQRVRTSWREFQDLLSTEISEARRVSTSVTDVRICRFNRTADRLIVVLFVPVYSERAASTNLVQEQLITYYQTNNNGTLEVRRCGPPIQANGTLDPRIEFYIGLGSTPGSVVLEDISVNTATVNNNLITIAPENPIDNALAPFTAIMKVIHTR